VTHTHRANYITADINTPQNLQPYSTLCPKIKYNSHQTKTHSKLNKFVINGSDHYIKITGVNLLIIVDIFSKPHGINALCTRQETNQYEFVELSSSRNTALKHCICIDVMLWNYIL